MAVYEIPLSNRNQSFQIRLSGVMYRLSLSFRNRWYISIEKSNEMLVSNIPLEIGFNILEQYQYLISGKMYVTNSNQDESQKFDDLGTAIKLYWID